MNQIGQHLPTQESIRIVSFEMFDTGSYNPMYARPYQLNIQNGQLPDLIGRIERNITNEVSPELFGGLASTILRPTLQRGHQIGIYNGWQTERIRFVLTVELVSPGGGKSFMTFQGFSDKKDNSIGGHLDPDMIFVVNSFVRAITCDKIGPNGAYQDQIIIESAQIINGSIVYDPTVGDSFGMRPMDIHTGIQSHYMQSAYRSMNESLFPTNINLGGEAITSRRINGMASNYLTKVINNYNMAQELVGYGQGEEDVHGRAYQGNFENIPMENVFFRRLSIARNIPGSVMFTMANLRSIDMFVDKVSVYRPLQGVARQKLSTTMNAATWHGSDNETLWSQILSSAVPAIMLDLLIGMVEFSATNDTIGGIIDVRISPKSSSFVRADMSRNFEMFRRRIANEVLTDISALGLVFYINMHCNVYNDTIIDIRIGSNETARFISPSFADGCFAPTFTSDQGQYHQFIDEFSTILNSLPTPGSAVSNPGKISMAVSSGI